MDSFIDCHKCTNNSPYTTTTCRNTGGNGLCEVDREGDMKMMVCPKKCRKLHFLGTHHQGGLYIGERDLRDSAMGHVDLGAAVKGWIGICVRLSLAYGLDLAGFDTVGYEVVADASGPFLA